MFANRQINISRFNLHAITANHTELVWFFVRDCDGNDCGYEGFEHNLSTPYWKNVDGQSNGVNVTVDAKFSGELKLEAPFTLSAGQRMGFLLFGKQGVRFEDDEHPSITCPQGRGLDCTEFSDTFLKIQPAVLVHARVNLEGTRPQEVLNVLGTPRYPRFFTGSIHYTSAEIAGDRYRCRFEESGPNCSSSSCFQDTAMTRAFSSNARYPVLAPQIVCAVPRWDHAEATFNLKVIVGNGDDQILFAPRLSGAYTDLSIVRRSIWWAVSPASGSNFIHFREYHDESYDQLIIASTTGNSKGGDYLQVQGFGFDSTAQYVMSFSKYTFENGQTRLHVEVSNVTVINGSYGAVLTPWWRNTYGVTELKLKRSDESVVNWATPVPSDLVTYNYTVGTPGAHECTGDQCAVGCTSSDCVGAAFGPACLGYSCTLSTWNSPNNYDASNEFNGRQFGFLQLMSHVTPSIGPQFGGYSVTVWGSGFDAAGKPYCVFRHCDATVPGQPSPPCSSLSVRGVVSSSSDYVTCATPTKNESWGYRYIGVQNFGISVAAGSSVTLMVKTRSAQGDDCTLSLQTALESTAGQGTVIDLSDPLPNGTTHLRVGDEFIRISDFQNPTILADSHRGVFGTYAVDHQAAECVSGYHEVSKYATWVPAHTIYAFTYQKWDYFTVGNISTTKGSSGGGFDIVIHGYGFRPDADPGYNCTFYRGSTVMYSPQAYVAAIDQLVCRAPVWGAQFVGGELQLNITGDGRPVIYTGNDGSNDVGDCTYTPNSTTTPEISRCNFMLYSLSTSVTPDRAGSSGGMEIFVQGFGFNGTARPAVNLTVTPNATYDPSLISPYRCLFYKNTDEVVNSEVATYMSLTQLRCITPRWIHGPGPVLVRLFDEHLGRLQGEQRFTFFSSWSSKNITEAPARGGLEMHLVVVGIGNSTHECVFSRASRESSSVLESNSSVLTKLTETSAFCITPEWRYQRGKVFFSVRTRNGTELPFGGNASAAEAQMHFEFTTSWLDFSSPRKVPSSGDTELVISAFGLDSRVKYQCRYNRSDDNGNFQMMVATAVFMSPTVLHCITPKWGHEYVGGQWLNASAQQRTDFQILQDGQVMPYDSAANGRLYLCAKCILFYTDIVSVEPSEAIPQSAVLVQVIGGGFNVTGDRYVCRWGNGTFSLHSNRTQATNLTHMGCRTPKWPGGEVYVTLTIHDAFLGETLGGHVSFYFGVGWGEVNISKGPARGNQPILLIGVGVNVTDMYFCRFAHSPSNWEVDRAATVVNSELILCLTPRWESPFVGRTSEYTNLTVLTSRGKTFPKISGAPMFEFFEGWDQIDGPTTFVASGGGRIFFRGYGFDTGTSDYAAMFYTGGKNLTSHQCSVLSQTALECFLPSWGMHFAEANGVRVAITHLGTTIPYTMVNGFVPRQCASDDPTCTVTFTKVVEYVTPSTGPASGGVRVSVKAFGLNPAKEYRCMFTSTVNSSVVLTSALHAPKGPAELLCELPVWSYVHPEARVQVLDASAQLVPEGFLPIMFSFSASWASKNLTVAPARGGTALGLEASGLSSAIRYWCQLSRDGYVVKSPVQVQDDESSFCSLPPWNGPSGMVYFQILAGSEELDYVGDSSDEDFHLQLTQGWDKILTPTRISAEGGEQVAVQGYGFDKNESYNLSFSRELEHMQVSAVVINSTMLSAVSPPWGTRYKGVIGIGDGQEAALSVLAESAAHFTAGTDGPQDCRTGMRCQVVFYTVIKAIVPEIASAAGNELLTVTGFGFDSSKELVIVFADPSLGVAVANSTGVNFQGLEQGMLFPGQQPRLLNTTLTTVYFYMKRWEHKPAQTEITIYQDEVAIPAILKFSVIGAWTAKSPDSGPASGGTLIEFETTGAEATAGDYVCIFASKEPPMDMMISVATPDADGLKIRCTTPQWVYRAQPVWLFIAKGDVQFSSEASEDGRTFTFTKGWERVTSQLEGMTSSPAVIPALGDIAPEVKGYGFEKGQNYTCMFRHLDGKVLNKTADVSSSTTLSCPGAAWGLNHEAGDVVGTTSLDLADELGNLIAYTPNVASGDTLAVDTAACRNSTSPGACTVQFVPSYNSLLVDKRTWPATGNSTLGVFGAGYVVAADDVNASKPYYTCTFTLYGEDGSIQYEVATQGLASNLTFLSCPVRPWLYAAAKNVTLKVRKSAGADGEAVDDVSQTATEGIGQGDGDDDEVGTSHGLSMWKDLVFDSAVTPALFEFYQTYAAASASRTSALGGTVLTITGAGFDAEKEGDYRCFFILQSEHGVNTTIQDGESTPVRVAASTKITCVIPQWEGYEFDTYFYLVFRNNIVWKQGAPATPFEISFYPEWSTFTPAFVDRLGGLNSGRSPAITVSGEGKSLKRCLAYDFDPRPLTFDMLARFQSILQVPVLMVESSKDCLQQRGGGLEAQYKSNVRAADVG